MIFILCAKLYSKMIGLTMFAIFSLKSTKVMPKLCCIYICMQFVNDRNITLGKFLHQVQIYEWLSAGVSNLRPTFRFQSAKFFQATVTLADVTTSAGLTKITKIILQK